MIINGRGAALSYGDRHESDTLINNPRRLYGFIERAAGVKIAKVGQHPTDNVKRSLRAAPDRALAVDFTKKLRGGPLSWKGATNIIGRVLILVSSATYNNKMYLRV